MLRLKESILTQPEFWLTLRKVSLQKHSAGQLARLRNLWAKRYCFAADRRTS